MPSRARLRRLFAAALLPVMVVATAMPVAAADRTAADLSATQLTPEKRIEGSKSPSARLARTDPELLARNDARSVLVMIKLDYDAVASYTGGANGLAATSPRATGKPLTGASRVERAYINYIKGKEAAAVKALRAINGVEVRRAFRMVYGGVAARIPANAVEQILRVPGVAAVQYDELRQPTTDSSTDFIGANAAYSKLGTTTNAGQGLIFANLDTGVWPEHPSFADQGNLPAPPARPGGGARVCDFGDNPLTPAADVFACQDKLIGGMPFLDTHNDINPGEVYPDTARDSDGHGTHTASTAAGNVLATALHYDVDRGPINGVAPGAHVMVYKVCGYEGCYVTDSAAAVEQALLDGVNVINFSVGGGDDPFTDPVELAFLDAYAAGVFVATSAGNDGPGAGTSGHLSPWVTTVGASTQTREFATDLTVTNTEGDSITIPGASITAGAGPAPIVLASEAPYSKPLCDAPAPDGLFAGKIVACERGGNGRVEKGYNVLQGDALGMVLYNPTLQDTVTDNHWLPTVHLADGTDFLAFMAAGTGEVASWPNSAPRDGQGDVMANFSSRGPGGNFIKPDVTAPGVQVLAGMTPTPGDVANGPPGEYFQAIAGTSMAAPHVAGAALLLRATNPGWSPGKIKSALMTTANRNVVKEDTETPATPLDMGAGRIDVAQAMRAGLTLDESAANFFAHGDNELTAHTLNIASVNANVVPGRLTLTRRVQNVTGARRTFNAFPLDNSTSRIDVQPRTFALDHGRTQLLTITIYADADTSAQQYGSIELRSKNLPDQHIPVAFIKTQGTISLSQHCAADELYLEQITTCDVTATNNGFEDQVVSLETRVNSRLWIRRSPGATRVNGNLVRRSNVPLSGAEPGVPSLEEYGTGELGEGFLPLEAFGIAQDEIGDEEAINYPIPEFIYNGVTYDTIGAVSNGYAVAGGVATAEDINCCTLPDGPDPAPPNNVLAPFWADLDGSNTGGIRAGILSDGVNDWVVLEFELEACCSGGGDPLNSVKIFQIWIGVNGEQDISFNYDPENSDFTDVFMGEGGGVLIGAENAIGQGEMIKDTEPVSDLVVVSTDPVPGQSVSYQVVPKGVKVGYGDVTTSMKATGVPGVTIEQDGIRVFAP